GRPPSSARPKRCRRHRASSLARTGTRQPRSSRLPRRMQSVTLRVEATKKACGRKPMARCASGSPPLRTATDSCERPAIARSRVDFPAPFGPTTPIIEPAASANEVRSSTWTRPLNRVGTSMSNISDLLLSEDDGDQHRDARDRGDDPHRDGGAGGEELGGDRGDDQDQGAGQSRHGQGEAVILAHGGAGGMRGDQAHEADRAGEGYRRGGESGGEKEDAAAQAMGVEA